LDNKGINQFVTSVASKEPAPGGGAVSALVGAVGAALLSMVANLTVGKEKYRQQEPLMLELLEKAELLQCDLISLIEQDAGAFNSVARVFDMPKTSDDEKENRKKAMEKALKHATEVPFTIMGKALEALHLHERALGNANPSVASDNGVGVLCLKTALMGAWLNVKINLANISDRDYVDRYEFEAKKFLDEGTALADHIYEAIMKRL